MQDEQQNGEIPSTNTLKPSGDLSIFEAAQFHQDLLELHRQEGPLALDLSGVGHVDSSGIQLIVTANRSGRMRMTGCSSVLREQFDQIGFGQFLQGISSDQETDVKNNLNRP